MGSSKELFLKYKSDSDAYVESGTFSGDSIKIALDCGFENIYSCDINEEFVDKARNKYMNNPNVIILNYSSKISFDLFFGLINNKATIFLDGHAMPHDINNPLLGFGSDTVAQDIPSCPLMDELEVISNHHIKNHTILIDDVLCFGTWVFSGITMEQVSEKIFKINPAYKLSVENNVACYFI